MRVCKKYDKNISAYIFLGHGVDMSRSRETIYEVVTVTGKVQGQMFIVQVDNILVVVASKQKSLIYHGLYTVDGAVKRSVIMI